MKNLVLGTVFTVILLSLSSCVSFGRRMVEDDFSKLKKENVQIIEGQYEYKGYEHIVNNNTKSDRIGNVGEMLAMKNGEVKDFDKLIIKSVPLAESKMYEIEFMFLKGDELNYNSKYQAKLKNGFLLLQNYNSQCHGVPYLLGGCVISQSRIGLTKDHHLLVQNYKDNSGAFLLFFWAGYTINYVEKYRRINLK